jgi:hypothetical protein
MTDSNKPKSEDLPEEFERILEDFNNFSRAAEKFLEALKERDNKAENLTPKK